MGGKRRDFSGQFAISEIDFWLNDPRVTGAGSAFRTYLHYTWMIAVKERREQLPYWWDTRSITKAAGLDHRTGQKCAREAEQKCLHGRTADGRVIVYGVKAKHPNLKWKDGDISEDLQPHIRVESETQTQIESETQIEEMKVRKKRAPDHKSNHHRDQVWDAFADRYQTEYGEPAIPKRVHFFNLARWRKAGRDNERMIEKVDWMFEWDLFGHTSRWTFEDFIAKYEKIPKPGESDGTPEKPTERIIREAREHREREARLADPSRPPPDRE